jgi:Anti-sigma factor NepR
METGSSHTASRTQGRLGRDVQAKIGNQLRAIYDDVVKEGVPDRFVDLLRRLDQHGEKGSES